MCTDVYINIAHENYIVQYLVNIECENTLWCSANCSQEKLLLWTIRGYDDLQDLKLFVAFLFYYFYYFFHLHPLHVIHVPKLVLQGNKKLIKDIMTLIKSTPSLTTIQQHSSLLSYYTFIHMQNTFQGFRPHVLWVQPVCYPRLYKTPSCHLPNSITHIHHPFICRRSNANERFL